MTVWTDLSFALDKQLVLRKVISCRRMLSDKRLPPLAHVWILCVRVNPVRPLTRLVSVKSDV